MFTQDKNDDFDWTRHSAATRDTKYTPNTGPSGDRSGSKQGEHSFSCCAAKCLAACFKGGHSLSQRQFILNSCVQFLSCTCKNLNTHTHIYIEIHCTVTIKRFQKFEIIISSSISIIFIIQINPCIFKFVLIQVKVTKLLHSCNIYSIIHCCLCYKFSPQ